MILTPSISLGWAHEFLDTTSLTTAQFAATGASFSIDTPPVGRDAAVAGVRADFDAGKRLRLFVAYNGAFADNSAINSITGGVQCSW